MSNLPIKSGGMKKAWLVQWGFHAQNEDECLRRLGISEKIVDVLSVRKDFDRQVIETSKDIYKQYILSFSEKVYLENYSLSEKRRETFF
ncbi:MAG: hypothetical protein NTV77_03475 [Candidatus Azambacteria bacterium]|nr:hypothetical protein [Candidatus Azambacteria bacterium]